MKKIIFATSNEGKMREIRQILADLPVEVLSMKEAGIDVDIVEDGKTFEENARLKAAYYVKAKDILDRADDPFLAYLVYSSLGSIYRYRDLYDASLEELRLCVKEIEKTERNREPGDESACYA